MYKDKLLTPGAALNDELMVAAYCNGDAAMAILGPWRLQALQDCGVPFEIIPIPAGPEGAGKPFLGVQGFLVSSFSKQPLLAQTFLQQFVGTEATMQALFDEGGRPTAFKSVNAGIEDPNLKAYGEAGAAGQAMPNIPQMSAVWSSWGNAMALIGQQAQAVEPALTSAAEQIRTAIGEQ
jgi:maltose-binding protein MalE